ncbi:ADP,ATP carrier protein 2, mitochondrial [Linum perenne]
MPLHPTEHKVTGPYLATQEVQRYSGEFHRPALHQRRSYGNYSNAAFQYCGASSIDFLMGGVSAAAPIERIKIKMRCSRLVDLLNCTRVLVNVLRGQLLNKVLVNVFKDYFKRDKDGYWKWFAGNVGSGGKAVKYNTSLDALKQIVKNEGAKSLFKGYWS